MFPMWIHRGGEFECNLQYVGDKLVRKITPTVVRYSNFVKMICAFLKIDCNKSVLHMKFNLNMK